MNTQKSGRILLVGFGPGHLEHLTARATQAIGEADVVIGYSTYIELVADLLDGKRVIEKGMTEELDRCELALELARGGQSVALISSGDVGIYGMAGPTFEVLKNAGWKPSDDVQVEVIPGVTALSACAARVGAPLTHDFASISLSDLLTPWAVIEKRLEAAAAADFVIALYNPKSGRRTEQIVRARDIIVAHRKATTPVALVKSAYRAKEHIVLTDLAGMLEFKIGMLTTVLVGNSNTFTFENLMVTPRGYENKYDLDTHAAHAGETPGRSLSSGLSAGPSA